MIIIGFGIALFGKPLFKPTICITTTLVGMGVLCVFIFSVFFNRDTPTWAGWTVFSVSLVIGAIVGLLLAKFYKVGVFLLATVGGFFLGIILYNAFMYKWDNSA